MPLIKTITDANATESQLAHVTSVVRRSNFSTCKTSTCFPTDDTHLFTISRFKIMVSDNAIWQSLHHGRYDCSFNRILGMVWVQFSDWNIKRNVLPIPLVCPSILHRNKEKREREGSHSLDTEHAVHQKLNKSTH